MRHVTRHHVYSRHRRRPPPPTALSGCDPHKWRHLSLSHTHTHAHTHSLALTLVLHSCRSHPVVPPPSLPARPFMAYGLRMRLLSIVLIAVSTTRIYIVSPSLILLTGPYTLVPAPRLVPNPFPLPLCAPLASPLPPLLYIHTYP